MTTRLLLRHRPRGDEALDDYLRRISHANGYAGSLDIYPSILNGQSCSLDRIAALMAIDVSILKSLPGPRPTWLNRLEHAPMDRSKHWFNARRIRWCPACFQNDQYMRSFWAMKLIIACPVHRVMLRESCDLCGKTYSRRSAPFHECPCGRKFSEMKSDPADDQVVEMMTWCTSRSSALPSKALAFDSSVRSPASLPAASVLTLLQLMAPLLPGFAISSPGCLPGLHALDRSIDYVKQCMEVLMPWPDAFRSTIQRFALTVPTETSIRRAFGPLYTLLYRKLKSNEFDFLRRSFESYLQDHWQGAIDGRHRKFVTSQYARDTLSATDIAEQLRRSRGTVQRLILAGVLTARVRHSPGGRIFATSDNSSVQQVHEQLTKLLDLRTASQALGISRRRLRVLMTAGVVSGRSHYIGGTARLSIHSSEIEQLLTAPRKDNHPTQDDPLIALEHVFRYRCRDDNTFIALVNGLIRGSLQHCGRTPEFRGFASFLVRKADIDRIIAQLVDTSSRGMDAQMVAELLSVKEEVAYHLIRCGLLASHRFHANGRKTSIVRADSLDSFRAHYVKLIDVAKQLRLSPKATLQELGRRGIAPITGPSVDGSRQYFLLRAHVESSSRARLHDSSSHTRISQ